MGIRRTSVGRHVCFTLLYPEGQCLACRGQRTLAKQSACCSLSAGAGGWRSQQALEGQSLCCPTQRLTLPRPGDPAPLLRCGKPSLILQAPPLGRLCREYTSSSTERQTVHHSANALRACDGSAAAVGAEDDADSAACLQEAQTRHKQKWK